MGTIIKLLIVTLLAILINLPFGYIRQKCEKFSFGWYFYIHISIPIIIYMRIKAGFSWHFIPITLCGAFAGQYLGGLLQKRSQSNDRQA